MYMYTQGHSRVVATGTYIPEQRITSREIMQQFDSVNRFGVSYDWLERVTGIKEKRLVPQGMLPSDMAVKAAQEAMERAKITANEIDVIIYAGVTKDLLEPATAHHIQAKLQAKNAVVFDVMNACHGFMNGMHLMDALIATGQARRGLIVTGEQGSIFADMAVAALKQTTAKDDLEKLGAGLTGGDAGAALIMGPKTAPDTGLMGFMLQSQGQHAGYCTSGNLLQDGPLLTDMPKIIGEGLALLGKMYQEFLHNRLGWKNKELQKIVVHQTGAKIFKSYRKIFDVPIESMADTVSNFGNLITANIPVNLHNHTLKNDIKMGGKVYLVGVGSGISLSQAGLVWDAA